MLVAKHYTAGRYGGYTTNYPIFRTSRRGFNLRLTAILNPSLVPNDIALWALTVQLFVMAWPVECAQKNRPYSYRVKSRVLDFPLEIWDLNYIKRVLAVCSDISEIVEDNIT